jgi:hypothetical protein
MDEEQKIEDTLASDMLTELRTKLPAGAETLTQVNLGTNELAFEGTFVVKRGGVIVDADSTDDTAAMAAISMTFRRDFDDGEGWREDISSKLLVWHKVLFLTVPEVFIPSEPGSTSGSLSEITIDGFVVRRVVTDTVPGEPVPDQPTQ